MTTKIRYRTFEACEGKIERRRVVVNRGFEGYITRWTQACSGCSDWGDYTSPPGSGAGCRECGYTGKSRHSMFIAFDMGAYMAFEDRRWARRERLLKFWRSSERGAE